MCRMTENLNQITQELASLKSGTGKATLTAFPKGESSRPLPSIRAWRSWASLKLLPWCGLQADGFADLVHKVLQTDAAPMAVFDNPRLQKANRNLAFELGAMLDEDTAPYVAEVDKTNGIAMLLCLATKNHRT